MAGQCLGRTWVQKVAWQGKAACDAERGVVRVEMLSCKATLDASPGCNKKLHGCAQHVYIVYLKRVCEMTMVTLVATRGTSRRQFTVRLRLILGGVHCSTLDSLGSSNILEC